MDAGSIPYVPAAAPLGGNNVAVASSRRGLKSAAEIPRSRPPWKTSAEQVKDIEWPEEELRPRVC